MKRVIQFTGLSGAGKTTLSFAIKQDLTTKGYKVVVLDGDELRKTISIDLGFSEKDRLEHLKRVADLADAISADFVLIAVINPYEVGRQIFKEQCGAKLIWLRCQISILRQRDTKGLYRRAFLPTNDPDRLSNLTGVNAPFEEPIHADLIVDTDQLEVEEASALIVNFILATSK